MSAVMRTLGRKLEPLTDFVAEPASGVSAGAGAGASRALMGEPGGPVTGVATPAPAVGSALSEATGPVPEEDTETPAPGATWLALLSRFVAPPAGPTSMSLSSATTVFALP